MGLKSAYRRENNTADDETSLPKITTSGAPADVVSIRRDDDGETAVNAAVAKQSEADAGAQAIGQRLEQLTYSEQLQHQARNEVQTAQWLRQNGIPDSQLRMLARQPGALSQLTVAAGNVAAQQYEPGSPEHSQAAV